MSDFANLKKELETFRDVVIKEAKGNLKNQGKVASGKLLNGIKGGDVTIYGGSNALYFEIMMPLYGFFVDKGVSGKEQKYNTPYSFKSKMPPPKSLDKWIVRKGLDKRDKGKFTSRKSIQFAIAKSIFKKGFKPSLFFTKPFEKYYKKLPKLLAKSYGLDVEEFMRLQFIQARQRAK